jgi:hypothetical protein
MVSVALLTICAVGIAFLLVFLVALCREPSTQGLRLAFVLQAEKAAPHVPAGSRAEFEAMAKAAGQGR